MTILDEAVAAAGVDPRALDALLTAGQPERTIELAKAFEEAGQAARSAHQRGRRAHAGLAEAFSNDRAAVLDAGAADQQAWQLLGRGGQDMEDTAVLLKRSVVALEDAQSASATALGRMTTDLNELAARWNQQLGSATPADRQQLIAQAAAVVTRTAADIQRAIDTYDSGLARDAQELAGRGYAAPGVLPVSYEGGVRPLAGPAMATPGAPEPYHGLSLANGLTTTGDVLSGFNGARLEVDAHYQKLNAELLRSSAQGDLTRLRAVESVLDPDRHYQDLDRATGQLRNADDLLARSGETARTSRTLPLKVGGGLALAGIGFDIAGGKDPVQAVASGGGGFAASVLAGAAIGTAIPIPGVGTAAGAVGGAIVGVFASGAIDSLFENGPDVGKAAERGIEAVTDTGGAVADGVVSVAKGIGGWFD